MASFLKNKSFETKKCIKPETINLSDCLACSGCITSEESEKFAVDSSFLAENDKLSSFIISRHSKLNLYSFYSKEVNFASFEKSLIKFLKERFNIHKIIDTSYFLKKDDTSCISSECPAVVLYVERVYPSLVKLLSAQRTYQQMAADFLKNSLSDHRIISIMQCYDKKDEVERDNVKIDHFIGTKDFYEFIKDDFEPLNGIEYKLENWEQSRDQKDETKAVTGLENCINIFNKMKSKNKMKSLSECTDGKDIDQWFELRICKNGCINGPAQIKVSNKDIEMINPENEVSDPIFYETDRRTFKTSKRKTFQVEW